MRAQSSEVTPTTETVTTGSSGYVARPLIDGFPGKSSSHGAFGWSSLWLLDDGTRRVLIDAGQPAYVPLIHAGLERYGLTTDDVTDVLLTHMHWDHVSNFPMFANATIWVGERELRWAADQPSGTHFIPDLHVQELLRRASGVARMSGGQEVLPGIHAIDSPGHTPHHLAFYLERADEQRVFAGDAVKNIYELASSRVDSTLDADASVATIGALRSLLTDTGATLVPGHDVELRWADGEARRHHPQRAAIGYFADATRGEEDRSIG